MKWIVFPLLALLLLMVALVPSAVAEELYVNGTTIVPLDLAEYPPPANPWLIHEDNNDDSIAPDSGSAKN